jgi:hypothetical protein
VTVSWLVVPFGGGATLAMAGAFGAPGPVAAAVVSVVVADHALVPVVFELCS